MTMTIDTALRSIIVEEFMPHAAEIVWKVLTTSELMLRWIAPNTFKPGLGQRFTISDHVRGDWDGAIRCETTVWDPPRALAYTWVGGHPNNVGDGAPLDTVVTWTLTPEAGGTRLRMEQTGFRTPQNDVNYQEMHGGWGVILPRIRQLAGQEA